MSSICVSKLLARHSRQAQNQLRPPTGNCTVGDLTGGKMLRTGFMLASSLVNISEPLTIGEAVMSATIHPFTRVDMINDEWFMRFERSFLL